MTTKVNPQEFLELRDKFLTIIDVRSPSEYALSHIPQAQNIPLFTDDERAMVGTLYKQVNRESAMLRALEIIGPKMASFVKQLTQLKRKKTVLVHCWRGGMRSESMSWLFDIAGFEVFLLSGGYKAYRNWILSSFSEKANLLVLGGKTGSGKTSYLEALQKNNEQVIDLEGLANHKGSAFGAIGQKDQPGTQQFENLLFEEWRLLDLKKPIWIEDESASIGKVSIPKELFVQIRSARVIEIELPVKIRVKRIIAEYVRLNDAELTQSIIKISKRLGGLNTTICLNAVEEKDYEAAVLLILDYYDKAYRKGLQKRDPDSVYRIEFENDDPDSNYKSIIELLNKLD